MTLTIRENSSVKARANKKRPHSHTYPDIEGQEEPEGSGSAETGSESEQSSKRSETAAADSVMADYESDNSSIKICRPRKKRCIHSDSSEKPDDDDDLSLSGHEEPETRLRTLEPKAHSKYAVLRKARRESNQKRKLKKEIIAKRVVPDSPPGEIDADSDDTEEESSELPSEAQSETDEEERKRQEDFVVDDMATQAQKKRVAKQMASLMPPEFRNIKQDNRSHFGVVCQFLVHQIFIPHENWRQAIPEFDQSCQHLHDFFQLRALQILDSAAWNQRFRDELKSRPMIQETYLAHFQYGCSACNNRAKKSSKTIRLFGHKYDPITLNPIEPESIELSSDTDSEGIDSISNVSTIGGKPKVVLDSHVMYTVDGTEFICGYDCAGRAIKYHFFKHWLVRTLGDVKDEVLRLRKGRPTPSHTDPAPSRKEKSELKKEAKTMIDTLEQDAPFINFLFQRFTDTIEQVEKEYMT